MLPLELVRERLQVPSPIFPFKESPPYWPLLVTGNSLLMRPFDVRAFTL